VWRASFDAADKHAQEVVRHLECLAKWSRFAGQLGTNADLACVRVRGQMVSAVVVKTVFGTREIFSAADVNTGVRIADPDTAEILTLLRAQLGAGSRALIDARPDTGGLMPPVVYRSDTVIHAWVVPFSLLPMPTGAYLGAEHHYIFSRDGGRELWKAPLVPRIGVKGLVNGEWIIDSHDSLPPTSALIMAHMLRMDSRPVTIMMPARVARLRGDSIAVNWTFEARKR
jgi:hypothetical protein